MWSLRAYRWVAALIATSALVGCGGDAATGDNAGGSTPEPVTTARFRIPSEGMSPTLKLGQIVTADLAAYRGRDPEIGDIVVFNPPSGAQDGQCGMSVPSGAACPRPVDERDDTVKFIKRVVAGPGDKLKLVHGHVILSGKRQAEPFARRCGRLGDCDFPVEITIPRGHYFMLGDNRGSSDDSRFWGPVPKRWIIARIDVG
jgi:signal peptidase I